MDEVVAYQTVAGGVVTSRYYPHYNHLYSVAALTDSTGAVVERYSYDAYGKQKITDASGNVTRAKSSVGWDRGFTGYITDNETGLLCARRRMYSPTLGRFVGRDPMGYVDGFSAYTAYYVPNSNDPNGTEVTITFKPQKDDAGIVPVNKSLKGAGPRGEDYLGLTSFAITKLECLCAACECDSSEDPMEVQLYEEQPMLEIEFTVTMAIDKVAIANTAGTTVDGTYGHEQKHIRAFVAHMEKVAAVAREWDLGCMLPQICKERCEFMKRDIINGIKFYNDNIHNKAIGEPGTYEEVPPNGPVPNF